MEKPNTHISIGGYLSKVEFIAESIESDSCMDMVIHSDGDFPTDNASEQIKLHLCDFTQLENLVKEWGDYFRKTGVISD